MEVGEACEALRSTLDDVKNDLNHNISVTKREIQGLQPRIHELEAQHSLAQTRLNHILDQVPLLNTEELEIISGNDVQGICRQDHKHQHFKFPPKMQFSIQTRVPIRAPATRMQSKGVVWENIQCEIGGKTFQAYAKPKMFADSFAQVWLYGWKKEIHAAEIQNLTVEMQSLLEDIETKQKLIQELKFRLAAAQDLNTRQLTGLQDCLSDLDKVLSFPLQKHDGEVWAKIRAALEARSISELASILNLQSVTSSAVIKAQLKTHSASQAAIVCTILEANLKATVRYLEQQREAFDDLRFSLEAEMARTEGDAYVASEQCSTPSIVSPLAECASEAAHEHRSRAMMALKKLEEDLCIELNVLAADLAACENGPAADKDKPSIAAELAETQRELTALEKTRMQLKENEKAIGVVAALRSCPDLVEAWKRMYKGNLLLMS